MGGLINKQYICYKEKMFKDNGWCYVFPWWRKPGLKEKNWGFCGSSCKLMQNQATMPSLQKSKRCIFNIFIFNHERNFEP